MEGDSTLVKMNKSGNKPEVNQNSEDLEEELPGMTTTVFATTLKSAVQNGHVERVTRMLDEAHLHGFDINQTDTDGATLLHWAAINGAVSIAELLLSSGSKINVVAGKLGLTPLMWAVGEIRLDMTVLLVSRGADLKVKDSTGRDALHIAANSDSFPIVAYLVAKGCDPNEPDSRGFTPLMWACSKVSGISIVRFLLPLTTSVKTGQDYAEGNTTLHWAIYSEFWIAVSLLLRRGVDFDIRNYAGETGRGLIEKKLNSGSGEYFLHRNVKKELKEAIGAKERKISDGCEIYCRVSQKVTGLIGILLLVGILSCLLEWNRIHWGFKFGLIPILITTLCYFGSRRTLSHFVQRNSLQLSIMAKLLLYLFWAYKITQFPSVHWAYTLVLVLCSVGLWWNFLRAWLRDPGILRPSEGKRNEMIIELIEGKSFDAAHFCPTCNIRRPVRSKHCSQCNHCVARFDHHCEWIGNCVGAKNHLNFLWYIIWKLVTGAVYLTGCGVIWVKTFENVTLDQVHVTIGHNLLLFIVTTFVLVNFFWISNLIVTQLYQILCLGVTTNEKINYGRYSYLTRLNGETINSVHQSGKRSSNGSRPGCFTNCVNFCNLTCCPNYIHTDWTATYHRPHLPRSIDDYFQSMDLPKDYVIQISDDEGDIDDFNGKRKEPKGTPSSPNQTPPDINDNQMDKVNKN